MEKIAKYVMETLRSNANSFRLFPYRIKNDNNKLNVKNEG